MNTRLAFCVLLATCSLLPAAVQAQAPAKPAATLTENELREVLVWNSPWEGHAAAASQLYSYRTTFRAGRDNLLVQIVNYATNQRSDSVVTLQDGRLVWQDSDGADVSVSLVDAGDLVGTASSRNASLAIVLKPRR
jgi:hypothetical protein